MGLVGVSANVDSIGCPDYTPNWLRELSRYVDHSWNSCEQIRERELTKTLKRPNGRLTSEEISSLDAMTRAITNKLLHDPTVFFKGHPDSNNLNVAKEIFRLSQEEIEEASNS